MRDPRDLSLYDIAADIYGVCAELEEAADAMALLREDLEDEGLQRDDGFDKMAAVNFVRRFPMHLSTYTIILRAIQRVVEDLKEVSDQAFDADRIQREAAKKE